MKKYLFVLWTIALGLAACKHHPSHQKGNESISEVRLPPPVVKPDNEVVEEKAYAPPALREMEVAEPAGNADIKADNNVPIVANTEKKIIKEGDIRFETSDVAQARKQIITSLKHLGGYAEDDSETTDGAQGSKEYTISIRIPAKNFDAFLGTVASTAVKIDSRNIRVKDVTTQFIDTKTRLDNKLQLEKRYLNLLNRAGKMRDLLDIEDKLTEIRSDIESTQSQLNYMSKQVAYSSLNITFYTKQAEQVAAGNGFGYKLMHSLTSGWDFLQDLFFGLLANWPLLIIIVIVLVLIRRWRRNRPIQA
jgi:hypothetical protein